MGMRLNVQEFECFIENWSLGREKLIPRRFSQKVIVYKVAERATNWNETRSLS